MKIVVGQHDEKTIRVPRGKEPRQGNIGIAEDQRRQGYGPEKNSATVYKQPAGAPPDAGHPRGYWQCQTCGSADAASCCNYPNPKWVATIDPTPDAGNAELEDWLIWLAARGMNTALWKEVSRFVRALDAARQRAEHDVAEAHGAVQAIERLLAESEDGGRVLRARVADWERRCALKEERIAGLEKELNEAKRLAGHWHRLFIRHEAQGVSQ